MSSSKQRFESSPTPPPTPVQNPFRKVVAAAGVMLILVMSVPMFADAVYGQAVPSTPGVDQTSNLISALTSLSSQIGLLKNDVASLRTQLAAGDGQRTGSSASAIDTTMADCLESCRNKLSVCLAKQPVSTLANPPLDACRVGANNCMNACRPRPTTTIACEDRCAVALGGCVVQAGDDATKLNDCRIQNRKCVIAACRPHADSAAPSRVPVSVCRDQCARDLAICSTAAAYDREELATCNAVAAKCLRDVCTGYEVNSTASFLLNLPPSARGILDLSSPGLSSSGETNTSPGQQITIDCENACTSRFNSCSAMSGSDATAQSVCNASFGTCRDDCRTAVGGGDAVTRTSPQ
ncbi:MAG: hypothetical protein ABIO72_01080 [Patescibacteria group bacterium]